MRSGKAWRCAIAIFHSHERSVLGPTKLEKSEFLFFLERSLLGVKDVSSMADLLASNNVDVFHLTYENLFKITDDNLQNVISNYDELKEWIDEYLCAKDMNIKCKY